MLVADISKHYEITDNRDVNFHLGCAIICWWTCGTIKVHQEAFTVSILHDAGMENSKPVSTPMNAGIRLTSEMCPTMDAEKTRVCALFPYCTIVGKCMYLSVCTHPDISYTICELAQFMSNYGEDHILMLKHLLCYLSGMRSHGLLLGQKDAPYPTFCALPDSDWGMGDGQKSISGFFIMLGDSPLSWSSKQQVVITLSSCEASIYPPPNVPKIFFGFEIYLTHLVSLKDPRLSYTATIKALFPAHMIPMFIHKWNTSTYVHILFVTVSTRN